VTDVPAWPRSHVPEHLTGPALIDQPDTTIFLPPGWVAKPHPIGTLILENAA
jgi:N-methylhydantoinase A/oxoprolinase/acetone carboxylase beta subunit